MVDTLQMTRSLGSYADVLADAGIVCEDVRDEAREIEIAYATDDSRRVVPRTLFVCKGAAFKREYLLQALAAGAVAYVSEVDYEVDDEVGHKVPRVLVNDIRTALGLLADVAYDHPSGRVKVCAFTGTKGKTTSTYYLRSILSEYAHEMGRPVPALLTGVEYDDGVERGDSLLTTPESFELERRFANAGSVGCEHVVMEASSQAIKFRRTLGVDFAVGAFTFGEDHISPIEHPTLEDYLESKLLLFERCRVAVVNLDMDVAERALAVAHASRTVERVLTYSLEDAAADVFVPSLCPHRARHPRDGAYAAVRPRAHDSLTRGVQLDNALGAIACAEALGISADAIEVGLSRAYAPGRMELYPSESGRIMGVVDYAHNGMSLETLLRDLRASYPDREFAVVFGATGGKGVDRRETMGEAAGKLADRIVITEDDPGPEDPALICDAIARAVSAQGNESWQVVLDRSEAIRTAVNETHGPAVVIVTGKGNDPFMLRHGVREPYEPDCDQLRRALADWEREHV